MFAPIFCIQTHYGDIPPPNLIDSPSLHDFVLSLSCFLGVFSCSIRSFTIYHRLPFILKGTWCCYHLFHMLGVFQCQYAINILFWSLFKVIFGVLQTYIPMMLGVIFSSFTIHSFDMARFSFSALGSCFYFRVPTFFAPSLVDEKVFSCLLLLSFYVQGMGHRTLFIVFMVQNNWHCQEVHSAAMHVH